jgi:hypothetical protein
MLPLQHGFQGDILIKSKRGHFHKVATPPVFELCFRPKVVTAWVMNLFDLRRVGATAGVAILPLRQDAPIYMAASTRPDFGAAASVLALDSVELLPRYQVQLTAK